MGDGYDEAGTCYSIPPELDEYICEYADGSMDPSVREAFEEYLSANPELAVHVEELRETADLLRENGHCMCAPDGFQSRLRCAVENECLPLSRFGLEWLSRISGLVLGGGTITVVCFAMVLIASDGNTVDLAFVPTGQADVVEEAGRERPNLNDDRSGNGAVLSILQTQPTPFRFVPTYAPINVGLDYGVNNPFQSQSAVFDVLASADHIAFPIATP